ncbi:hypothetical protein ETAE_p042 (plasmid) [Edwardsiella piscicida]|uniref:Uncharacterized protein n=1 Tax=Edwardsiella piscicida TaxID=1263550 RepID=A0AAU8P7Q5_EDWPI|nr:hypothetical protein ETAE_p042 [Edwardsiella tarda EIB202]
MVTLALEFNYSTIINLLKTLKIGLPDCSRAAVAAWSGLLQVLDCTIQKRGYNLDCIIQK